jgi:hypothetical protein
MSGQKTSYISLMMCVSRTGFWMTGVVDPPTGIPVCCMYLAAVCFLCVSTGVVYLLVRVKSQFPLS